MDLVTPAKHHVSRKTAGMLMILQSLASIMEGQAKTNAIWTDRTGNARIGLKGGVEMRSPTTFVLYLGHSVEYGIWLEKANAGNYAIIKPTIDANENAIKTKIRRYWRD